jgi:hypothetical protein
MNKEGAILIDVAATRFCKEGELINLSKIQVVMPQLTMGRLMLLIAIIATCFALYATSGHFSAVSGAASPSAGLTAALAWSLAAALPALWVGTVRRTSPDGLLGRVAIGNGFLAILMAFMGALLFVVLLALAVGIPSVGWYRMSRVDTDYDRERVRRNIIGFLSMWSSLS